MLDSTMFPSVSISKACVDPSACKIEWTLNIEVGYLAFVFFMFLKIGT